MANKIYFKNKHSDRLCFSSDIFQWKNNEKRNKRNKKQ